jgi:hypothetical protein
MGSIGVAALSDFLVKYPYASNQGRCSRTYITARADRVVGYYTMSPASVAPEIGPLRVVKDRPCHPLPCTLLARLAVDTHQETGG